MFGQVWLEGIFSLLLTLSRWGIISIIYTLRCRICSPSASIWCFICFPEVLVSAAGNSSSSKFKKYPVWITYSKLKHTVPRSVLTDESDPQSNRRDSQFYQILRPLTQTLWLMLCWIRWQLWVSLKRDEHGRLLKTVYNSWRKMTRKMYKVLFVITR